ncbi:iron-siderophore ABC transporter substrate-binding protein [Kineosporia mesophila]|uniref:Iron-siderophore ABC transporter substrate-binding protein n=1 Tax=Kineosporia mesophila TaxID=566012 RepID=A0ABP6ZKR2_9ACTN|nr:ABC transporter substrate-binding protein [Kineosporia mesophila]MCD5349689.1 ABC transporter substrate-binding protein [Kineosporia mesophila]
MNRPYRALALVAVGALVGTLTACTSDAKPVNGHAGPAAVTVAPAARFPATVETFYGDITIRKQPERVVALGYGDADALLALGTTPVAMKGWPQFGNRGSGPWMNEHLDSTPQLIPSQQMNADDDESRLVAQLNPDLIIDTDLDRDPERYKSLAKIAPVIGAPKGLGEFGSPDLEEQTMLVARAMGVPRQGQELLDDLKTRTVSVAREHPEFDGRTISLAQKIETSWFAYVSTVERMQFFIDLGFRVNPALAGEANKTKLEDVSDVRLTPKNFTALDADLVVVDATYSDSPEAVPRNGDGTVTRSGVGAVTGSKRFAALPATRDGRSLVLPADPELPYWPALDRPSVLSANWLLDTVVPEISRRIG